MSLDRLSPLSTITWVDRSVRILDQRLLPRREIYRHLRGPAELERAIRTLAVRGAPALGIAGAYGVAVAAARAADAGADPIEAARRAGPRIAGCRPTAVNLSLGVARALARADALAAWEEGEGVAERLAEVGTEMLREDLEASRRMAEHGAALLPEGRPVLTHCNTGGLATGGLGTALAVIRLAAAQGRIGEVLVDETRPLLQGGRLTLWELERAGIRARLLCEGAAAWALQRLRVGAVLVGADRIARNGDTANKIGTLGLALGARAAGVPFFVVAPQTTFDPALADGAAIPVEERAGWEVLAASGWRRSDPVAAYNPAFDVTPTELITAWITDSGVLQPPFGPAASGRGEPAAEG